MNFEPFPEVEFTGGSCVCSSRRIRIAGLSRDTTEDSLKNVLQYFGDMECEIWPPSKSALVTFYDLRAAQCCLMKLRLIPSMTHVRLDPLPTKDLGVTLSIPIPNVSYEQLQYELSSFGSIQKLEIERKLVPATQATCIYWDTRSTITASSQFVSIGPISIRPSLVHLPHSQVCRGQQRDHEKPEWRGYPNDASPPAMVSDYVSENLWGGSGPTPAFYSDNFWTASASNRTSGVSPSSAQAPASPLVIPSGSPASSVSSTQTVPDFKTCRYLLKRYIKTQEKFYDVPSSSQKLVPGGTQPVTPTTTPVGAVGKVTLTAIPGKDQATPKLRESNYIDLNAIAEGTEKRTTVMLRNIPNKVDQKALKSFLDETNAYTYDFLYLRIDFGNKCNVGYAFISFTEPKHISRFVVARRGAKWNHYNSEKVIDVSFANYQGRENLIKKFRNSPIMDADPAYRPKLYYTSGPLLGSEEPFPPPTMDEDY